MKKITVTFVCLLLVLMAGSLFADNVTFTVDMRYMTNIGLFDPATTNMAISGGFNEWASTNMDSFDLADAEGDTLYSGAFDVAENTSYKYVTYDPTTEAVVEWFEGSNIALTLTGADQVLDPFVFYVPVKFQIDMSKAIRENLFNPDADTNWVQVVGNFTNWQGDPTNWATYKMTSPNNDNWYEVTTNLSHFQQAELEYKFMITDGVDQVKHWESLANRLDTLDAYKEEFLSMYWDSIPVVNAVTAQLLFQTDVTPILELGAFDPLLGDQLQLRGDFNEWGDADPAKAVMYQSLGSETQYELLISHTANIGDDINYKFVIKYDTTQAQRDLPDVGGIVAWEEPASTGGGNRVYKLTADEQQAVPGLAFNDIFTEDVIPEGTTVSVTFTAYMKDALRNSAESGLLGDGPLQLDEQDPIWRWLQGAKNADSDTTTMVFEDADGDSIFTLTFDLVGPVPNWVQYKLQWDGTDEEGPGYDIGRRRVRYVRKNNDGTWPSTYEMGLDVWNYVVNKRLTTEERDGVKINDEIPGGGTPVKKSDRLSNEFALKQNYPNPFNPSTTIDYHLAKSSHVTLTVYNLMGQEVIRLVDEVQNAGSYSVNWDVLSMSNKSLASGVYLYRLDAGDFQQTKRLLLLK